METAEKTIITVNTTVNAPVEKVWQYFTLPHHVIHWNYAADDWHSTRGQSDLRAGGSYSYRMEAKDGSFGFDFSGEYTKVEPHRELESRLGDGRLMRVVFEPAGNSTNIIESFEAEETHSEEMQRGGWQAILENFKKYAEKIPMDPMHFEISINAPVEQVYKTMIDDDGYREWTAAFCPTSHYKGSWDKGAKIVFIGTNEEGVKGGMVSRIKENVPNEFISIEHLGVLNGEEEVTSGPMVEQWAGALENYTFRQEEGKTTVLIDVDTNEQFKAYFEATWPIALSKLKEICER